MTRINYEEKGDREFVVECKGHAGYANAGNDIVCAGISTLVQTLVSYLPEAADTFSAKVESGNAFITAKGRDAFICYKMMMEGLRLIESSFPQHIEITEGCTMKS